MRALLRVISISMLLGGSTNIMAMWLSMNSRVDPLPPYTTLDPHTFLYTRTKNEMKGFPVWVDRKEVFGLSISPFGQNANRGRDINNRVIPLGDVGTALPYGGRWDMIALLFGPLPAGKTLPPTLAAARAALFPTIPPGTPITDKNFIDKKERIGFFSIGSSYRKRGLRFQAAAQLLNDIGLMVEGGVSDICHTVTQIKNLTCDPMPGCESGITFTDDFSEANINDFLMDQLPNIAEELCINLCNFHKFSFEDLRFKIYWRHAYELNKGLVGKDYCWSQVLAIPFIMAGVDIHTSKDREVNHIFAIPFGNDGHNAVGVTAGINFDFIQTIEIGGEAGITHFFDEEFCNFPIPNHMCQQGIFPFMTNVKVSPGNNWHFALKMSAYHFVKCLSFYFQYVLVHHEEDKVCLKCPDPAYVPEKLECISTWKVQVANMGFNYDISPEISLGFLWQAPLARRNAYRSTTVMFSLNVQY